MWQRMPLVRVAMPLVAGMLVGRAVVAVWVADVVSLLLLGALLCVLATMAGVLARGVRPASRPLVPPANWGVVDGAPRDAFGWQGALHSLAGALLMMFFFVVGFALFQQRYVQVANWCPQEGEIVEGVVVEVPQERARTWAVRLAQTGGGEVMVYVRKSLLTSQETAPPEASPGLVTSISALPVGRHVQLRATRVSPTCPSLLEAAGDTADAFAAYHAYLFYRSVVGTMYLHAGTLVATDTLVAGAVHSQSWRERTRGFVRERYAAAFSGETAAMVEAMTMGDKSLLDRNVKADFSTAGLSHLLALSGFHLSILLTLLDLLLLRMWLPLGWRRAMVLVVVPVVWCYVWIVGAPASLVRAAIMCSLLQVGMAFGWGTQLVNTLAAAAIVMVAADPLVLMQVGFQLSFAAMLGIACVGRPGLLWWGGHNRRQRWYAQLCRLHVGRVVSMVGAACIITLAASMLTLPLVAYHFGRVPLLSVLANVLGSLLSVLLMWGVVAWWLLGWIVPVAAWIGRGLEWVAGVLTSWARWVAGLPCASVEISLNVWELVPVYAFIFALLYYPLVRRPRPLYVALVSVIVFCLMRLTGYS